MASLRLIVGPMFSGKTTRLIEEIKKHSEDEIVVAKPSIDDRYSKTEIVTHDGVSFKAKVVDYRRRGCLKELDREDLRVLFVDEINFFDYELLSSEIDFFIEKGVDVWLAGVEYDFRKEVLGPIHFLRKRADEIVELVARCDNCRREAKYNYNKKAIEGQIAVGGEELYGACCEKCFDLLVKRG